MKVYAKLVLALQLLGISWWSAPQMSAQDFPPVASDELKMTAEPQVPGAPAIILQRRVDRNDELSEQVEYFRIKILTEEGRKYANIEIPFYVGYMEVKNILARTIKPDGSVSNFNGQIYERDLVKGRWVKYFAKTFALPDVQVGSILEYSYTLDLRGFLFDSHWILNSDLFTKSAQFSFMPRQHNYGPMGLRWTSTLPIGVKPRIDPDHVIRMEASNIPAFEPEEFMPPENELKSRVDFIYQGGFPEKDPDKFWKNVGTTFNTALEAYLGKPKPMEEAVRQIVSPDEPPETKLRKIYARVQAIRNTSYEVEKTEKEEKRNKEKLAKNVAEVWKHGYGNASELPWLFLGLARAAGFEAYGCLVSNRSEYFFDPKLMQRDRLRNNIVLVKLNGKEIYFDPGAAFAPFGWLPWNETSTQGIRLDKTGETWIRTPLPDSSESKILHVANFKLSPEGTLEGKLTMTYTGLEAMRQRVEERNADEVGRKKVLEDQVKVYVPAPAEAELTKKPDWNNPETPLTAEFAVRIPNWTSNAGRRVMVPVGIFSATEKHMFEHAERVHSIYFGYPYGELDDVTIELPEQWQVVALPSARTRKGDRIIYKLSVANDGRTLHLTRELDSDISIIDKDRYSALRDFFDAVRIGDGEQIVVQPGAPSAAN